MAIMSDYQLLEVSCIKEAASRLGLPILSYDKSGNFFSIDISNKKFFFANWSGPWNSDSTFKIFQDKEFFYFLVKDKVEIPRSLGFLDPFYEPLSSRRHKIDEIKRKVALEQLAKLIADHFRYPFVLKRNSGMRGINVFLVKDEWETLSALSKIFNINSYSYDYVALAQEYVESVKEYRAVIFRKEFVLIYEKGKNVKAVHDTAIKHSIINLVSPIFDILDFDFAAFDIILGKDNKLYLLEGNSRPSFRGLVQGLGKEVLIEMYSRILFKMKTEL
jgi:hypothetical protein